MFGTVVAALALTAGANAASIRRSTCDCSFTLTTSGHVSYPVGEDGDGEVLGGSTLEKASFCLNGDTIYDSNGNGCWFTPPSYVLQCDVNSPATTGFSIGCDGVVSLNGSTTFYECANGIGDEVNLYSKPDEGSNCGSITLTADGCHAACSTTSTCAAPTTVTVTETETVSVSFCPTPTTTESVAPPPPTTSSTTTKVVPPPTTSTTVPTTHVESTSTQKPSPPPTTTTTTVPTTHIESTKPPPPPPTTTTTTTTTTTSKPTTQHTTSTWQYRNTTTTSHSTTTTTTTTSATPSSTCPLTLPADYQFPHLIIPIDSSSPSTAAGTSFFGQASSTISTIFNFDIPESYSGSTCTLWFSLPRQDQLETSSFTLSGSGGVEFFSLKTYATESTDYDNAPAVDAELASVTLVPGNSYEITSGSCAAGQTVAYEIEAVGSTDLWYFQDYNPCPIGLYILPSN